METNQKNDYLYNIYKIYKNYLSKNLIFDYFFIFLVIFLRIYKIMRFINFLRKKYDTPEYVSVVT